MIRKIKLKAKNRCVNCGSVLDNAEEELCFNCAEEEKLDMAVEEEWINL